MANQSTTAVAERPMPSLFDDNICELVRDMEDSYTTGTTTHSKYVEMSMYEDICKIDAYLNSKHITGDTDSMGREKPFFNIVTAAVNIWYRATDIDRKNILIKAANNADILKAFLATVQLQRWMRRTNFGAFLNDWGRALARYGSVILKFVEQDGELHCMVMPWNRMIVDQISFDGNVRIEILELTPAQLKKKKGYDKKMVKALLDARQARETMDGHDKDSKDDYIKIYEVHGELPLSYITGKERDADTYRQQMHVVSFVAKPDGQEGYDDFTLIKGREKKDPYMITHLIREDGQTLSIGAVQHLFEAQWMQNHTVKLIKDHLDLASKLIFQTADGNFVGQNALDAIETGDILIHAENMPLTQINNGSHDITSLQSYGNQWKALSQEITSTPDAIAGNKMPSGTAYRQVAILNQESHSLFEIMTENKGLYIEEMLRNFIIPFLKTKMDTTEEVSATLADYNISKIDRMYIPAEAAKRIKRKVISSLVKGEVPQGLDLLSEQNAVQTELSALGNERFFVPSELGDKTWKEFFDDFEWEAECEITDETTDKEADLATLSTVLQTIAANPNILQDPNARMLFNKILTKAGQVSPVELAPPPPPAPVASPATTPSPNPTLATSAPAPTAQAAT